MIWFKVGVFAVVSSFVIWVSNYSPRLHADLNYFFGYQPKKNPSRLLDAILIFIMLFGCLVMVYFTPTKQFGVTVGSIIGMIIMVVALVSRRNIHN